MKNKKNKSTAGFTLFIVIAAAAVFIILKLSSSGNEFINNYTTNAQKNINNIKNMIFLRKETGTEPVENTVLPIESIKPTEQTEPINQDRQSELAQYDAAENKQPTARPTEEPTPTPASEKTIINNVPFENADSIKYAVYKDMLVCADSTSLMSFDKMGNSLWAVAVSYAAPILKTNGNYILIADKGGKLINVFVGNKLLYSKNAENVINSANINSNGDVIIVTEKEQYRSCVVVYNKEGEIIFSRSVGSQEVIAADISDTRLIAVTLLNTEAGANSQVQIWDINEENKNFGSWDTEDEICFKNQFAGNTLFSMSDKGIRAVNKRGKNIWSVLADDEAHSLISIKSDDNGNAVSAYDNTTGAYLKISDANGKIHKTLPSDIIPDFVDINSSIIAFNNGRTVFMGQYTRPLISYSSNKDIVDGMLINSNYLVIVHNNSLEFINISEYKKQTENNNLSEIE